MTFHNDPVTHCVHLVEPITASDHLLAAINTGPDATVAVITATFATATIATVTTNTAAVAIDNITAVIDITTTTKLLSYGNHNDVWSYMTPVSP